MSDEETMTALDAWRTFLANHSIGRPGRYGEVVEAALVRESESAAREVERLRIAERLLLMLHLYPNYPVESRGPSGLILDVLDVVAPAAAAMVRAAGDPSEIHDAFAARLSALETRSCAHHGEPGDCVDCAEEELPPVAREIATGVIGPMAVWVEASIHAAGANPTMEALEARGQALATLTFAVAQAVARIFKEPKP